METVKISEIIISERFRKNLGELSTLVQSIKEVGLLHPIVISEKNELIAGWRRIKAFQILGLTEIPCNHVNLADLRRGEIHENIIRKDFTTSEAVAIKRFMEPEVKEEHPVGRPKKNSAKLAELKGLETRQIVASYVGKGHETLRKEEAIVEAAEKEPETFGALLSKVDNGIVSVDHAYRKVKAKSKIDEPPVPLPEGLFNVIYADPPWQYDVNFLSASADSYYSTMKTEEICKMVIPSADDAILFLWATNPLLQDALLVMESWGFSYKTNMVWVKDKIGLGFYLRGQHELLLIGVKGKIGPPEESRRVSSVLPSVLVLSSKRHNAKPEKVYEIIEYMYPNAKYLELFAREKRRGWEAWGHELST